MGKGDIKTKKGKRRAGSYGVTRRRKKAKNIAIAAKTEKTAKKPATKKTSVKKSTKKTDKPE